MPGTSIARLVRYALLPLLIVGVCAAQDLTSTDIHELIKAGDDALAKSQFGLAARAFQRVVDLNPSSVKGHEGLGTALSQQIMAGNVRPANDSEAIERAESHLKQASALAPSSAAPLLQLAELEDALAARTYDPSERSQRYSQAQEALKQVIALDPSNAKLYLQLAKVERDEFGPPIQQAQSRMGQQKGPLPDANLRASLRQQYEPLIKDAIRNAQQATNMNGNDPRPLLLLSRLYRERAVLRESQDEYASDMHKASDWQRQFLAVGGHLDTGSVR